MQLYVKFLFTLTVGLIGVGLVLKTLLESLFREWDAVRDFRRWTRSLLQHRPASDPVRAEDILMELERGRREGRYQRQHGHGMDRRREALREVREAEERLAAPHSPEVV